MQKSPPRGSEFVLRKNEVDPEATRSTEDRFLKLGPRRGHPWTRRPHDRLGGIGQRRGKKVFVDQGSSADIIF